MSCFAAAGSWQTNCAMELPQGIICSNVERKNKFKRFKAAVSKIFIVALHQMTIKHLQEVDSVVDCPGVEVFSTFRLVGCLEQKSPPSEVMLVLLKSQLVVNKQEKD